MARGDYVEVTYRLPTGSDKHKLQATTVGGNVHVDDPRTGTFITVEVLDKNDKATETARFAKSEIIAIVEGHEAIRAVTGPRKLKRLPGNQLVAES